jgi:hypothetical protein
MMMVDMQIALGGDGDIDPRMARQRSSMWSRKPIPVASSIVGSVEIDRDLDVGFLVRRSDALRIVRPSCLRPGRRRSSTGPTFATAARQGWRRPERKAGRVPAGNAAAPPGRTSAGCGHHGSHRSAPAP